MEESSDDNTHKGFVFPAEYAEGIAQIISCWSALESNINMAIWHLAGVYPAIGACLTEQIFNLNSRLRALLALLKLRRASDELVGRVKRFSEYSHKASDIRNRVVHHTWHQGMETKKMMRLEIKVQGTLAYGFKPIEPEDLNADIVEVRKAMREASDIRDAIERALPTLPDIPLTELHPTVLRSGGSPQTRSSDYTFVLFPPKPSRNDFDCV